VSKVAVLSAGAWGTALCFPLSENPSEVWLWVRDSERAREIQASRRNDAYLPGVELPSRIQVCSNLKHVCSGADVVFLAVPSQALREVSRSIAPILTPESVVVSAAKGLEQDTHLRMTQVIAQEISHVAPDNIACISGPNFAIEVAMRQPTATVIGAGSPDTGRLLQEVLITPRLRVYTNPDVAGVELGGALKNVIALAVGIAEGMNLGYNARAALITRGIAEIARLGVALRCHPLTFAGLSGMGDLVLTCTGEHSRNRKCGVALGQGRRLADFLRETSLTVEGVSTAQVAREIGQRLNIDLPVTEQVYQVLFEDLSPLEAVRALMTRTRKHEIEEVAQYK